MKHKSYFITVGSLIALVALGTAGLFSSLVVMAKETDHQVRKIVVFEEGVNEAARETLIGKFGGVRVKNLNIVNGKVVLLPEMAANALAKAKGILRVDDDVIVNALAGAKGTPAQPAEVIPWGVNRIDADLVWSATTGDPVKVAVVDTGIDLTHPDLAANIKGGYNAINPTRTANDDNGHGTHVAGIIGALDNTIGVVGVGPKVDLYAVKVLNRNGSGYLSDIIEGIDWSIQNGIQVINMSLGTASNVQSFHDAVVRAYQTGIVVVAAAGNNYGGAVDYPGAYPEVIAVSATNSSNGIASFSSVGPEVDLAAPGASIFSSYKGSTYKTLSGTSMASPHVAGAAALVLTVPVGAYDLDADGAWDPQEVVNKLKATAELLPGLSGNQQGAGLVDAEKAVTQ